MTSPSGRFSVESHDHNGSFVASLPYRNVQGEWMLGKAGSQLRLEIPHRNYPQVTQANLYPGKHEIWLYDHVVSDTDPIFAGPVWDITAQSSDGVLAVSAQDALTYLAKRLLKTFKAYSNNHGTFMINDLLTYVQSQRVMNMAVNIVIANTQSSSPYYLSSDRNVILDLIDSISNMDDGVDYFMRCVGGQHQLNLYGGHIQSIGLPYVLEYGGWMDGYAVQYNAQGIANNWDERASTGVIKNASDAGKIAEYNALYQATEDTDQVISADVQQTATTNLKDHKSTKVIPSIVTRRLTPIKDFDFGGQFQIVVDDGWVQVSQIIRAIGWQYTIAQGDKATTVVYSKDTEGV